MVVSEMVMKWAMRFYPPLFFQRIWVVGFTKDFKSVRVKISKSLLNKNYNDSLFGGTIYSAADPFYPILFHQVLLRKNYDILVWTKSAQITYFKPGRTSLYFEAAITEEDISEAEEILNKDGKYHKSFRLEIYDKHGDICATIMNEVYLRNKKFKGTNI